MLDRDKMVTAVIEQGYRRSVSSERLNPDDARLSIEGWLMVNSSLSKEQLKKVVEFRLSDQQRAFLANPVTEEPLVATIEGLDAIKQLDVFDKYSKRSTFSANEKREYLGCVGEWLRHCREMYFYLKGVAPERYLEAERELDGALVNVDLKLQEKSLGFYLLAHKALDLAVDYTGSAGLIKAIEENRDKLKPVHEEFQAVRAKLQEMKSKGRGITSDDYNLTYDSYASARSAFENMPHEPLWILEHVRPLLDNDGNTLFSAACAKTFGVHYASAMGRAHLRVKGIGNVKKGRGYSDKVKQGFEHRADNYFGHLSSNDNLSKLHRAMFNTFCFLEE